MLVEDGEVLGGHAERRRLDGGLARARLRVLDAERDVGEDLPLGELDGGLGAGLLVAAGRGDPGGGRRRSGAGRRRWSTRGVRDEELERVLVDVEVGHGAADAEEEGERDLGLAEVLGRGVDGLVGLESGLRCARGRPR